MSNQRPSIVDPVSVITQYKAYKIFVVKNEIKWESAKRAEFSKVEKRLRGERSLTLASIEKPRLWLAY